MWEVGGGILALLEDGDWFYCLYSRNWTKFVLSFISTFCPPVSECYVRFLSSFCPSSVRIFCLIFVRCLSNFFFQLLSNFFVQLLSNLRQNRLSHFCPAFVHLFCTAFVHPTSESFVRFPSDFCPTFFQPASEFFIRLFFYPTFVQLLFILRQNLYPIFVQLLSNVRQNFFFSSFCLTFVRPFFPTWVRIFCPIFTQLLPNTHLKFLSDFCLISVQLCTTFFHPISESWHVFWYRHLNYIHSLPLSPVLYQEEAVTLYRRDGDQD